MSIERNCEQCGTPFKPGSNAAKYCSDACRLAVQLERNKAADATNPGQAKKRKSVWYHRNKEKVRKQQRSRRKVAKVRRRQRKTTVGAKWSVEFVSQINRGLRPDETIAGFLALAVVNELERRGIKVDMPETNRRLKPKTKEG